MSLLEDLDQALGQAILHGFPIQKADKARSIIFEIDRRVVTAVIALEQLPYPADEVARRLKPIIPSTEHTAEEIKK